MIRTFPASGPEGFHRNICYGSERTIFRTCVARVKQLHLALDQLKYLRPCDRGIVQVRWGPPPRRRRTLGLEAASTGDGLEELVLDDGALGPQQRAVRPDQDVFGLDGFALGDIDLSD